LGDTLCNRDTSYSLVVSRADFVPTMQGDDHAEPSRWCGVSGMCLLVDYEVLRMSPYILIFITALHPTTLGTFNSEASCQAAIRTIYETKMYGSAGLIPKNPEIDRAIDIQLKYQTSYRCVPK